MKRAASALALILAVAALAYVALRPHEGKWILNSWAGKKAEPHAPYLAPIAPCPDCNVILISLDTLRADRLDAMPNLKKIADQSLIFTHAYANGYFTTPSHMSVFTSLYPARHRIETKMFGVRDEEGEIAAFTADNPEPLSSEYVTWAEVMRRSGYDTYWNAPIGLRYLRFASGFNRGFNHFAPSPFARGLPLGNYPVDGFRKDALKSLREGKKTFNFLHSYIAHGPYIVHSNEHEFLGMQVPYNQNLLEHFRQRIFKSPEVLLLQSFEKMPSPEELRMALAACTRFEDMRECFEKYSTPDAFWHAVGQIQHRKARREIEDLGLDTGPKEKAMYQQSYTQAAQELDRQIGQMWAELEKIGALDKTVVAFFSDHGESLLERGEVGHGSFYNEVARIPMLIYHPKLKRRIEISQLTTLVDLMPAVLNILGIDSPPQTQGRVPWKNPREFAFGSSLGSDFITDGRWKLITDNGGEQHFYDLHFDPQEQLNLIRPWHPHLRRAYQRMSEARRLAAIEISL